MTLLHRLGAAGVPVLSVTLSLAGARREHFYCAPLAQNRRQGQGRTQDPLVPEGGRREAIGRRRRDWGAVVHTTVHRRTHPTPGPWEHKIF